ncbi:acetate/propionate family kinase [Mycoplasmopsis opalescens]|uniref:acetate/propionate family kinase n=1 Tax=Mycoplasmopsis opalescens TaxID=114886 RepID=UPI0004A6DE6D|nr:acetate/propionate family kinase [Mycoplasmopsis opalescens]
MKKILVVNPGSSTLKWKLFDTDLNAIASGLCERITIDGRMITKKNGEKITEDIALPDHPTTIKELIQSFSRHKIINNVNEIIGISFRTPSSGHAHLVPELWNPALKNAIAETSKFIPIHSKATLITIDAFEKVLPNVKKAICQDTAFHVTMPEINKTVPINQEWAEKYHIKRFGYHGLSYDYITNKMKQVLNKRKLNLVIAHLGSGSSVCLVKNSESNDVSVAFSSIEGLIMGTRTGNIDPGVADYLIRVEHEAPEAVYKMMTQQSGLLGVSGVSNDVRDLHKVYDSNPKAKLAIDMFTQKAADYIVSYLSRLEKVDALIFTAGIGENDEIIRDMIIKNIHAYDLKLSKPANLASYDDYVLISSPKSELPIYKMRTDEELVMARYTLDLINK